MDLIHTLRKIFVIGISALTISCCGQKNTATPDSGFADYIEAYTGGIVTDGGSIVVELVSPAEKISGKLSESDKEAGKLFKFSPSLKGSARWTSPSRIEFVPEEGALKPGKTYDCTFMLGKVTDTDSRYSEFRFRFVSAKKEASLEVNDITVTSSDIDNASVSGTLILSTGISVENPEDLLSFGYPESGFTTEIKQSGERAFDFNVTGLKRNNGDNTLTIKFLPGKTGFDECGTAFAVIPAKGKFNVIDTKLVNSDNNYIDVTFSEPLDSRQNLDGLVSVTASSKNNYYGNGTESLKVNAKVADNKIRLYLGKNEDGSLTLELDPAIRDMNGNRLGDTWRHVFTMESPEPGVAFAGNGSILPDTKNLVMAFVAKNLKAVDISIIKIYPSNVLMFLQDNSLNGDNNSLRRAGRMIYRNTLRLDTDPDKDLSKSNTFTVDLSSLFKQDPNAIYRARLSFRKEYYIYSKDSDGQTIASNMTSLASGNMSEEDEAVWDTPNPYFYYNNYDWSVYEWQDRNNPMTPSYYMNYDYPEKSFMASKLGVVAKYADAGKKAAKIWVAVSDIITAEPVSGAEITAYNYQLQEIGSGKSDAQGLTAIDVNGKPFAVRVKKGESVTYIKVTDGEEMSLSRFDTGGEILQKGLKGFVYGERGVWRPGDTLHLNMILFSENKIPDGHPAAIDIYTPLGQFFTRKVCRKSENGFYTFEIPTSPDSPTGLWNAYVKVGGATFHKPLRIEAIKPNRLKVNVDFGSKALYAGNMTAINISSNWLTGPAASGLLSTVSMTLRPGKTSFSGFDGYTFRNPASSFETFSTDLARACLDNNGVAHERVRLPAVPQAPGMLSADVLCSVFENGGDESFTTLTMPYSPFSAYVGAKLPADGEYIATGTTHNIPVAVVSPDGKRISGHQIEWRIFKLKWSWWWESRRDPLDSYINASAASAYSSGTFRSGQNDMNISFNINDNDWGRYLIYIKDLDSGHATGRIFYADMTDYIGRSSRSNPDAPAMLSFATDKKSYKTGETATVFIPSAKDGRALVSIENGTRVLSSEWVKTSESGDTPYKIKVNADMAPNFYIHITLVQPYWNTSNDLPVRMYGVQPVMVENPDSHLEPVISMPDKIHPEEQFTVKISEKKGKTMTYTLAIVDEGLLDLTAFRTPDPWNAMYKREALGVKTWDIYDNVYNSFGGALSAMFSVGGDEGLIRGARKENRFNPIVKVLGPFTLKSGSNSHKITLPMYVGSVRVMVVAGYGNAFGNAEKTVPVTSPVMILPTLPRFAGCGETITLPVNVFVMEEGIGNVNVSVRCDGPISIEGNSAESLAFSGKGDKMARFTLKSGEEGQAKVTVSADGNGHKMTETINLEVRNQSPEIISESGKLLSRGESTSFTYQPFDASGNLGAWIEISGCPTIGWNTLFNYMRSYQHSCTEQLAAKGLSLLYAMKELTKENAEAAKSMIPGILSELYGRQLPDGGFAYWPNYTHADEWVTSMAGEFMTLADAEGYEVSSAVMTSWKRFQKRCVQNFRTAKVSGLSDLTQAYRLFTLALAQSPEESAMNRMKESGNMSWQASMMLASAYSVCGKKTAGSNILNAASDSPVSWTSDLPTFSTPLRDKAIAMEAMVRTGNVSGAVTYAHEMLGGSLDVETLSPWSLTTQESAFLGRALSILSRSVTSGNLSVSIGEPNESEATLEALPSDNGHASYTLHPDHGKATVKNTSDGPVYVRMTTVSRAAPGETVAAKSSGIDLSVRYVLSDGSLINPASLRQGTEFTAIIHVANRSVSDDYSNLALTQMIPSGWEIVNERMTGQDTPSAGRYDYLDIRDDRNIFYFSLPRGTYKEFRVRLRAAYEGQYILPSITCDAMYNAGVYARTASGKASVTR